MSKLTEVPTDELLSFQDYPTVHNIGNQTTAAQLSLNPEEPIPEPQETVPGKSFWTLEYYQQFFDVDTNDVLERIIASITPRRDSTLKHQLRTKPDLYGPFWITITLIFTIAISGNIANYLQYTAGHYHWKYDFHLVSYAATAIYCYVFLVPFALWSLLKYSSDVSDLDGLENDNTLIPSPLELICIYGYSLFIYIPASILWTIQINFLQWSLVLIASLLSGSVLLFSLMPALRLSRHKFFIGLGVASCHLLLAVGFMLYFFHVPNVEKHLEPVMAHVSTNVTNQPL